jgi:hypothetical protein
MVLMGLNLAIAVTVLSLVGPYNAWPFQLRGEEGAPVLAVGTGRNPRLVTGPLANGAELLVTHTAEGLEVVSALQEVPEAYAMASLPQELQDGVQGLQDGVAELGLWDTLVETAQAIGKYVVSLFTVGEREPAV